uniref:TRC8-like N-terminal domain-containing protein n=1 Tax=Cairina moschata TaxID=8855 RepID=A0A8C3GHD4_CAIMO
MAATRPGGRHRAEPRPSPKWPPPGASPSLKMAEPRGPKAPVPASKMAAAASAAGGPSLRASPPRTGSAARGRSGRKRKWRRALGRRRVREGRRGRGPGPPGAPAQGQARPGRAGPGRGSSPGAPPGSPVPAMSRLEAAANVALRVPALALLDVLYRWDAAGPGPLPVLPGAASCLAQLCVCTLCALLMRTRQAWLFAAPLLPVLARLCGVPLQALPLANTFAAVCSSAEVLYVLSSHLLVPFQLAAAACREVMQAMEVYRLLALGVSLWSQLAVPLLFLVFWLVLFSLRLSSFLASSGSAVAQQGLLFVLLSSVAECCSTPYSLVGLTFTVSYLALGVLNLCKFYLLGFGAFHNGNVMHRGVTEGVMLLLLALQTGLLDLQVLQRTFLLSIILFIVVTSTLQSMIEIADPIVLALGASRNRCRAPGGGQQEAARRQRVLLGGARGGGGPPWLSCAPPQEPLEAFPWCQHVPLPADLPLLHGLQDRPLLPPGLLAAHPGLQLHAHLPAGTGGPPAPGGGLHIPSHSPGSSPAPGRLSRASLGRWSTAVGWCRGVLCPASSTQRVPLPPQVLGTLFIYGLFVVELLQDTPLERMDEIIYGVTAVSRVLEFLVALCVVAYGSWESLVGEWSWMGASVIIVHSYFNVWLRAQSGWRSLLLRRQAAQKISSLPRATRGQLRDHDDVCAICFQVSPRSPPAPQGGLRSSPQGPCRRVTPPPCARRTCRWPSSPPAATSSTAPASASGSTCRTRAPCATSGSPRRPPRTMPAAGRGRRRGRPRRTRGWRTREPQRGPRRTSPPVGTACRQAQGTAGLVPAALSWVKKRRGPPHSPPGCPPARTRSSCCPPLPAPTPL